jgi:hypothetical protein
MKIEMTLAYHGLFKGEPRLVYLLKDEGTGLYVEVPEDLLPKALARVADEFREKAMGGGLPVTLTLEWPG